MNRGIGLPLLLAFLILSLISCRRDPNQVNPKPTLPQAAPVTEERKVAPSFPPGVPPHGRGGPYLLTGSFSTGEGSYVRSLLADGDFSGSGPPKGSSRSLDAPERPLGPTRRRMD
ncbi:MAG: hypothetical protein MPW14_08165 [Candidatus Manganitrophus sp.]|nr:MAG: hypothetical protein MPW14_08165 [Candidatus Manganitrophus sp.]